MCVAYDARSVSHSISIHWMRVLVIDLLQMSLNNNNNKRALSTHYECELHSRIQEVTSVQGNQPEKKSTGKRKKFAQPMGNMLWLCSVLWCACVCARPNQNAV